jgi:hypothetical protein
MSAAAFALELNTPGSLEQWVIKGLCVIGGAAVGGFLAGLITQVLARLVSTRAVPRVPLNIIRLLGAIVLGWVVALFMFGGGGDGFGGPGGWLGFGGSGGDTGQGTGKAGSTEHGLTTGKGKGPRDSGKAVVPDAATLRVEVLGVRGESVYRIEGDTETHTLAEMRTLIQERRKKAPLQRIVIVIYRNSPEESKAQVTELEGLARELSLTSLKEKADRDAP